MWINKFFLGCLWMCLGFVCPSQAQVWQWSTAVQSDISPETNDHPQAFLWIPESCKYVRGVVVGQHNMLEEGILEHANFRKKLTQLGFAEVWVTPAIDVPFDWVTSRSNNGAGAEFNDMMTRLAKISGYGELTMAPIVPMGHSALASYSWNFAAWNPGRTLAAISIHGDAPLTKLTGSGRPNPDWGSRTIEGVPGLMVMGEYEWWEDRLTPAFDYVAKHPNTPFSLLADAGRGHFDYSDELVDFLALYIEKAATYRLPDKPGSKDSVILKPVNLRNGWLMDRWRKDSLPTASSAPYGSYKGKKDVAVWCFDKEMADAAEAIYQKARGKKQQYLGFQQAGKLLNPTKTHANYQLQFLPDADGITFHLKSVFTDSSRVQPTANHASTGISVDRICGPVKKLNDTTFQLSFYRMGFNNPKRSNDIWLLASANGDQIYKSMVQQADLRFPLTNKEGKPQTISFPPIPDQTIGINSLPLNATSDALLPVQYYVKEGPVIVQDNQLVFTRIPPRSKLPMKVTVVAWQYGTSVGAKVQSAMPVEHAFFITGKSK
ncbi:hypothetical protein [Spirosoma endophyticum]|uniref:Uncharacterized protein n=1 Tax=Spirosoma endophyticum TaxID=662367 RepID=A0A1I1L7C9_9BACT|nr:hypothetical protein [Spirosoma endophyticum]SFC66283.1 hypothetical protein SAMN05216167_10293 [Spirosoma endophyticum]